MTRIGSAGGIAALGMLAMLAAVPVLAAEPTKCDDALNKASTLNGFALFEGATACANDKREADVNFLLIAGQVRAMTDLTILKSPDADMERAAALYSQIYYQFGGLGAEAIYRTAGATSALETRLRAFAPTFEPTYDPGWRYLASSKTDIYDAFLISQRDNRIWEMLNYALKLQDDEYYAVQQELDQLQRDNAYFEAGTPAEAKWQELSARQRELAKRIPELPPPPQDTSFLARLNEPSPEQTALKVASGSNGPASNETVFLHSEAEARTSWLVKALSPEAFADMLAKVDFTKQALFVYAYGPHTRASGEIEFSRLAYSSGSGGYAYSLRIGVVPEECGVPSATSYPFIVGVVEAVPGSDVRSSGYSNFGSACRAVVASTPTLLP